MGPFKALGKVFNTVGTVIDSADSMVTRTSKLIDDGFDMADSAISGVKADLATDTIVANAQRQVREKEAQAQAKTIIDGLKADK